LLSDDPVQKSARAGEGVAGVADAATTSGTTGVLVTLDGPTGAGKTTVSMLLAEQLAGVGVRVLYTAQPSRSPLGEMARRGTYEYRGVVLSCLVAADRYDHVAQVIEPALAGGQVVVCDRYVPSALALDLLDGLDASFVWNLYRYIRWPDLATFLFADAATCLQRTAARGRYSRSSAPQFMHQRNLESFRESAGHLHTTGINLLAHEDVALKAYHQTRQRYLGPLPPARVQQHR
jgi:dTMP kinase